ncbi:hypothetical protein FRC10_011600 [Ceratobasidium sp. 414]|nr:hypothetical protein FRC10_011600 [Ceratobasidium sp. 414]
MTTSTRAFVVSARVLCDPTGDPPVSRQFRTSFEYAGDPDFQPDTITDYLALKSTHKEHAGGFMQISAKGPPLVVSYNVLGVVDMLSSDLITLVGLQISAWSNNAGLGAVPDMGFVEWDSLPDVHDLESPQLRWKTFPAITGNAVNLVSALNTTIMNIFKAVRDAIRFLTLQSDLRFKQL